MFMLAWHYNAHASAAPREPPDRRGGGSAQPARLSAPYQPLSEIAASVERHLARFRCGRSLVVEAHSDAEGRAQRVTAQVVRGGGPVIEEPGRMAGDRRLAEIPAHEDPGAQLEMFAAADRFAASQPESHV